MSYRATITLDKEAYEFLLDASGTNRSAYINKLLKAQQRRELAKALLQANQEEAADDALQAEFELWDATLLDGIE